MLCRGFYESCVALEALFLAFSLFLKIKRRHILVSAILLHVMAPFGRRKGAK